jgi:hypothetical protein
LASGTRTPHSEMIIARSGGQTAPVERTMPEKTKARLNGMKPQSTMELMWMAIGSEGLVAGRKACSTQGSAR